MDITILFGIWKKNNVKRKEYGRSKGKGHRTHGASGLTFKILDIDQV